MKKGDDFENVIKDICLRLSMKERVNAKIETKVQIPGDDGTTHEIDILYSFEQLGVFYKVAIECKNWKNPINVSELRNFDYKLNHIGGINGIFISAESKFQNGAKIVSEYNGIKLIEYKDSDFFAKSEYIKFLKPDFNTTGDPFWMLMDINGISSIEQNCVCKGKILLFASKKLAEVYKKILYMDDNIIIVGVSQEHLKEIQKINEFKNIKVYLKDFRKEEIELTKWDIDLYIR
ncbi:restriction endonuclease [Parvimonas micra]